MTAHEGFAFSRAMLALELLAFQPSSAPQVAGALRIDPRTARRLLNRLVDDGWLVRTEGRRREYAPTMRVLALAAQFAYRTPLARAAQPAVTRLHEETGGVAHLAIPSYRDALCLVHRAGGPDVRPQLRELVPAHASAAGKVLLAYRDAWREYVLSTELVVATPRTTTDTAGIRAEAGLTRERGYATEFGELEEGRWAVAVPVHVGGSTPASLAVSLEGEPMQDATVADLARRAAGASGHGRARAGGRGDVTVVDDEMHARDAYDVFADFYDAFTAHYDHDRWARTLEQLAIDAGLSGKRLLDLACGTGLSLPPMAARGYDVVACDVSPRMAAVARNRAGHCADVHVHDMRRMPQLGEFDLIWSLGRCAELPPRRNGATRQCSAGWRAISRPTACSSAISTRLRRSERSTRR